ncbi:MAG: hypothetical protein K2P94_08045 [Rhodospirillaceae bacterium]|nr:hypothetical protein [Rhodospirillaceae bacterium]
MEEGNKEHASNRLHDVNDLRDMLDGLRILLPSAQLLTAFLIILPFNSGFANTMRSQEWAYLATFLSSLVSLVLFSAPAVQHRLMRPLDDRVKFKEFASKEILSGAACLSLALILATHLVTAQVFGDPIDLLPTAFVAVLISMLWWLIPRMLKSRVRKQAKFRQLDLT